MKLERHIIGVTVVTLSILMTGCVNPDGTPNNTASGALLGGAIGALAGAASSGRHGGQNALENHGIDGFLHESRLIADRVEPQRGRQRHQQR